jgi:hypothetical protein
MPVVPTFFTHSRGVGLRVGGGKRVNPLQEESAGHYQLNLYLDLDSGPELQKALKSKGRSADRIG